MTFLALRMLFQAKDLEETLALKIEQFGKYMAFKNAFPMHLPPISSFPPPKLANHGFNVFTQTHKK